MNRFYAQGLGSGSGLPTILADHLVPYRDRWDLARTGARDFQAGASRFYRLTLDRGLRAPLPDWVPGPARPIVGRWSALIGDLACGLLVVSGAVALHRSLS